MGNSICVYYYGHRGVMYRNYRREKLRNEANEAVQLQLANASQEAMMNITYSIVTLSRNDLFREDRREAIGVLDDAYGILRKQKRVVVTTVVQVRALGYLKRKYAWNGQAVLHGGQIERDLLRAEAYVVGIRCLDYVTANTPVAVQADANAPLAAQV